MADALRLAVAAQTERSALAVLIGLVGVDIPVGSAILTTIDAVLDFRALYSLSIERSFYSVDFYLD
jgi:hypothetical protein